MSQQQDEVARFVAAARSYVNTPFVHQGRVPGAGLDCAGVVVCAARAAGFELQDGAVYERVPRPLYVRGLLQQNCATLPDCAALLAGSLVLAWVRTPRLPVHLLVCTGQGTVIHSTQAVGRVCEVTFDQYWRDRVTSCWHFQRWQQSY